MFYRCLASPQHLVAVGFIIRETLIETQKKLILLRNTLCAELSWSHYRLLMKIDNEKQREFYMQESADAGWSVCQLVY